jgi:catechol 2,3-dioxygenase
MSGQTPTTRQRLDPRTTLGPVRLTVGDADRTGSFYERAVGLRTLDRAGDATVLGVEDGTLLELVADPGAPPRPPATTGLFHLAVLVPDRPELARALRRVAEAGARLSGASDHLVSEALYLSDPEGNGIEIYRDRPRDEWQRTDGNIVMSTLPLDLRDLLSEAGDDASATGAMAPGTRIGHVHLQVADLRAAEDFYAGVLGFEVTVRGYPGALFVSAGGYHHHIGLNTWAGEGAAAPPPGARGLRFFEVDLAAGDELARVTERLQAARAPFEALGEGVLATDPSGNRVALVNRG